MTYDNTSTPNKLMAWKQLSWKQLSKGKLNFFYAVERENNEKQIK